MATIDSNIDLSILKGMPKLDRKATLIIRPLAPLSMVSELPGSFYKTLKYPSKKMICGLFENMLGWHFDAKMREVIFKDMAKARKTNKVEIKKEQYIEGSTYLPLLMDYFDISGEPRLKEFHCMFNYSDYWSRGYRRSDSSKHLNGCRNIDIHVLAERHQLFSSWNDLSRKEADAKKDGWFKQNMDRIPLFYTSPKNREYVYVDTLVEMPLQLDANLANLLLFFVETSNICYLGHSEGWVNVELKFDEL